MAVPPTKRGSSAGWRPVRSHEKHCLEHFQRFCLSLQLPNGLGPFVLEDHELTMLRDYFAGVPENLWVLPTGQRKSMLLGALALHMATYVRENARIFILGGMGGHGRHALNAAAEFVDRSPDLSQIWVPQEYGMGRLKSTIDRGIIVVVSAGRRVGGRGGSSVEGEQPDLILVEELHRHEDGGGALNTLQSKAQKKSHGGFIVQSVIVTTAGDNLDSPLGRKIAKATDVANGAMVTQDRPGEYYRRGIDADGYLVMHEWAVPDEIVPPVPPDGTPEGIADYRVRLDEYIAEVKKANPASFRGERGLKQTFKQMSAEPWTFQRQCANQWVTQAHMALDRVGWMLGGPSAERDPAEIPNDTPGVVIGLDLSDSWDRTAIVPVVRGEDDFFYTAKPQIIRADGTGRAIRKAEVFLRLEALLEAWPDAVVAFDKSFGGEQIAEDLEEKHGIRTVNVKVGKDFEQASMRLAQLIAEGRIRHDGNDELTAHILAAARKQSRFAHYWRLWKPPDGRPIDGAAALANAVWAASNPMDEGVILGPDDFRFREV